MIQDITQRLELLLREALVALFPDNPAVTNQQPQLENPKNKSFGDIASTIALRITQAAGKPPLTIAEEIKQQLLAGSNKEFKQLVKDIQIQKPGFINFFFSDEVLSAGVKEIITRKDDFGRADIGKGEKVQIEFVSANPTGPLTVAHARQAAVGNALANIFSFLGFAVTREYYVNDEGLQIELLGKSVKARYDELLGEPLALPEEGYQGNYIIDIAKEIIDAGKKNTADFSRYAVDYLLDIIKKDLNDFNVAMDVWSYQSQLSSKGDVHKAIEFLKEKGFVYEQDGATWFASTRLGDDKDRVLIKSNGTFTYLAPDIAYHRNKYKRGFKRVINIWGPDHHGYIPRLTAAIEALGQRRQALSVIIVQLATLYRGGEPIQMSTRRAQYITLREVMEEVGSDVARFFFLMRRTDSHLAFDLDLAKKHSAENPVYYIQYAHARIASILAKAAEERLSSKGADFGLLKEPEEADVIKILIKFPLAVEACVASLDPYSVVDYLQQLATAFHKFYDRHRVIADDKKLSSARLGLVEATRIVLANGLQLLGVSVPDTM